MNPRVSRSSALASKATGFPIAKIAAKLALGYHLDEIPNDITRLTPASFEPTIDYVVVKIPRWTFEKFPQADRTLTTQMKSVGEVMAIGRTFKEAFMKAFRSLELGAQRPAVRPDTAGPIRPDGRRRRSARCSSELAVPNDRRMWALFRALDRGWTVEELHELTKIDPWFLRSSRRSSSCSEPASARRAARHFARHAADAEARRLRRSRARAGSSAPTRRAVSDRGWSTRSSPAYKRIDTCAAEFESFTPYMYGTYEQECEAEPTPRQKVVILGSGPNRIGQGIEFDYCCCHAAFALREEGFETVMINCNPETVSTDYDTADRLYFEPLTFEDVIVDHRARARQRAATSPCVVQFGGQTPLKLALALQEAGVQHSRHLARLDRSRRGPRALRAAALGSRHPAAGERHRDHAGGSARGRGQDRLSAGRPAVVRARRARDGDRLRHGDARSLHDARPSPRRRSIRS